MLEIPFSTSLTRPPALPISLSIGLEGQVWNHMVLRPPETTQQEKFYSHAILITHHPIS